MFAIVLLSRFIREPFFLIHTSIITALRLVLLISLSVWLLIFVVVYSHHIWAHEECFFVMSIIFFAFGCTLTKSERCATDDIAQSMYRVRFALNTCLFEFRIVFMVFMIIFMVHLRAPPTMILPCGSSVCVFQFRVFHLDSNTEKRHAISVFFSFVCFFFKW